MKTMRMTYRWMALPVLLLATGLTACRTSPPPPPTLLQVSTISALLEGCYDGVAVCGELKERGNLGIGTFDRLDGEMILIDGLIFQARADGTVSPASDKTTAPFAAVTRFQPELSTVVSNLPSIDLLKSMLDPLRASDNQFYAIRVDGQFDRVKYRSVPAQTKPYPKLASVASRQPVFERESIPGSLVGFWCPEYARAFNVPGYHLHFIADNRQSGGHLLDCVLREGTVRIGRLATLTVRLPQNDAFDHFQAGGNQAQSLKAVESGK